MTTMAFANNSGPNLVLIPATPLSLERQSPLKNPRESSETAIFSIYSMYGDNHNTNTPNDQRPLSMQSNHIISGLDPYQESDLAYYADHTPPLPSEQLPSSSPNSDHYNQQQPMYIVHDSPRASLTTTSSACPPSSYATPSSIRRHSDLFEDSRTSNSANLRTSDFSASSYAPGLSISKDTTRSHSPHSKHSSRSSQQSRHTPISIRDLPPLPPSRAVTPADSLQRQPSPSTGHLTPKTSIIRNGKPPTPFGSPSSKVSLVPSEGEDVDAFHVRNTYAQLEALGVKGDGYEEGVERTRARVGNSRSSQLQADAALGDSLEKKRELDFKEIQVLQSVDRYGFFVVPSHDRLVLLNSAPLLKKISNVSAGPSNAQPSPTSVRALPAATVSPKEPSRIAKWTRMLVPHKRELGANVDTWRVRPSKASKLRERTYKGVPDRWRRAAWDLFMTQYSNTPPQTYYRLGDDYREALDKPSTYDIQIDLDVPRTISGHIMFRTRYGAGQRSLFHVLHSFSLRCPTCGYVQGMGPIAATLLCYFEPERVYASLVILHDAYNMHDVFSPGFPGLLEAIYVQERIMETMMPAVYAAFKKHLISTTAYATKWYITLFANSVPFQTQLRLWDAFLLEGYDLFIAVAIAIVWSYRDHITSTAANFETILSLLSSFFVPENEDILMSWIGMTLGDKKLRANMQQWRRDWKALVAAGKDGSALL